MTPEDLWWQDELQAMNDETVRFYEEKFSKEKEMVHPILEKVTGNQKMVMAHRINSAWRRVQQFISWEQFVKVSSIFLEADLVEDKLRKTENITENVLTYIHFELEDIGIEVTKLRLGMRVSAKNAKKEIRDRVMDMIVNHNLLSLPTKEDIKLSIWGTLVD